MDDSSVSVQLRAGWGGRNFTARLKWFVEPRKISWGNLHKVYLFFGLEVQLGSRT